MTEEGVIEDWCQQVRFAWTLARGERLGELHGKRAKSMDARGLHPYSQVVGHIMGLQTVVPLLRELEFDPVLLRMEARLEAEEMFRQELLEEYERRRYGDQGRSHPSGNGDEGEAALRDLAF